MCPSLVTLSGFSVFCKDFSEFGIGNFEIVHLACLANFVLDLFIGCASFVLSFPSWVDLPSVWQMKKKMLGDSQVIGKLSSF